MLLLGVPPELRGCSSTTIRELAKFSERRSVRKGELLFEAGDGIDEHIFVLSGALQITKPRTDGAVNHVATVGAVRTCIALTVHLRSFLICGLTHAHMCCRLSTARARSSGNTQRCMYAGQRR